MILHALLSSAVFFSNPTFLKNSFSNTIRVSNSLDPDHAKRFVGPDFVGPDLGLNCLPGYQQTTLVGKELIVHEIMVLIA